MLIINFRINYRNFKAVRLILLLPSFFRSLVRIYLNISVTPLDVNRAYACIYARPTFRVLSTNSSN